MHRCADRNISTPIAPGVVTKGTCKPGQRSDLTGCTPDKGPANELTTKPEQSAKFKGFGRTKPLSTKEIGELKKLVGKGSFGYRDLDPNDYDNKQQLTRGKRMSAKGAARLPETEPHSCHGMSARAWKAGKGRLVTGFAKGIQGNKYGNKDLTWVAHSWIMDNNGHILEGTPLLRVNYFGYIQSDKEAEEFYQINKDNVESKDFKTYPLSRKKK